MTCPFCAHWEQREPNCGHALYNGLHAPAKYITRGYTEAIEIGSRARNYRDAENSPNGSVPRLEHITRQFAYAAKGGWKKASDG